MENKRVIKGKLTQGRTTIGYVVDDNGIDKAYDIEHTIRLAGAGLIDNARVIMGTGGVPKLRGWGMALNALKTMQFKVIGYDKDADVYVDLNYSWGVTEAVNKANELRKVLKYDILRNPTNGQPLDWIELVDMRQNSVIGQFFAQGGTGRGRQ